MIKYKYSQFLIAQSKHDEVLPSSKQHGSSFSVEGTSGQYNILKIKETLKMKKLYLRNTHDLL